MTKQEFIIKLTLELHGLPKADIEERVGFYSEMIDDRIEAGLSEEEAVADIGGSSNAGIWQFSHGLILCFDHQRQ